VWTGAEGKDDRVWQELEERIGEPGREMMREMMAECGRGRGKGAVAVVSEGKDGRARAGKRERIAERGWEGVKDENQSVRLVCKKRPFYSTVQFFSRTKCPEFLNNTVAHTARFVFTIPSDAQCQLLH
jgi:hypothetical protein